MQKAVNVKIHGAIILLSFLIFFPIGIVLLIIRYGLHSKYNYLREKDHRLTANILLTILGIIALICLIATMTGDNLMISLIIFLVLLGLPALLFYAAASSRKKKMDALYKLYSLLITEQGKTSIAALSLSAGEPARKVKEDVRYMIATGHLPDASITLNGDIVLPDYRGNIGSNNNSGFTQQAAAAKDSSSNGPKSEICSGCGAAVNVYPGKSQECEFCGNIINGR